jgi:hypothetical protein
MVGFSSIFASEKPGKCRGIQIKMINIFSSVELEAGNDKIGIKYLLSLYSHSKLLMGIFT